MNPNYPVYVITKGRWERPLTINALTELKMSFKAVVEPKEYDNYLQVVDKRNILLAPENFSEKGQGSIPVRNFVWEHSISQGSERHWLIDDNIRDFERLHNNRRYKVKSGTIFRCAEDFVDRYENIAFAGFEYRQFQGGARSKNPPYKLNRKVYSCTLIKNDLPYRWRGKYNEDTDICIRALKDGWVTLLFNCFRQSKDATMTSSGGNLDIYKETDNRKEFVESLQRQHPHLVKMVWRYGRWHHEVNYDQFKKNKLVRKQGLTIPDRVNNYGMILIHDV